MRQCWISPLLTTLLLTVAACGDGASTGDGGVADARDGDGGAADAPGGHGDGGLGDGGLGDGNTSACGTTECSDCLDNDNDGTTDGFDVECTGAADDDEGSFATGIPGDNIDANKQDCFFDGNSGAGNDGCDVHTCCILGITDAADCPFGGGFNPADCDDPLPERCIDSCAPVTPPGCDCFGCCTVCDPTTDDCRDILINPAVAPDCDASNIGDPTTCPACTKNTACGSACDPANCILCPGQTAADLPPSCTASMCPAGQTACVDSGACGTTQYCSNGCCIDGFQ